MTEYRNTGAPFTTEDGKTVGRGEVADLSGRDARMRLYKLEPVGDEELEPEPDPLGVVDFASDAARDLADEHDMDASDFDGHYGTGQGNAFRKADVEELLEGD